MKFRVVSDLHTEFDMDWYKLPITKGERQTVLVLPGDIGLGKSAGHVVLLKEWSDRFKKVLYIPGNHEYYGSSLWRAVDKIKEKFEEKYSYFPANLHINETIDVVVDDVAFIGAVLWTDMNKQDPFTMFDIRQKMNDFKLIRTGIKSEPYQRRFQPKDAVALHFVHKHFVFDKIAEHKEAGRKVVVFTHMAPSELSTHPRFAMQHCMNGGYRSNLEAEILDDGPSFWFHGHMHDSFDYELGETRVICNPRGYAPDQFNPDYNPVLTFEL